MSNPSNQAIPPGMTGLIPHLVIDGAAKALEFYKTAFGAEVQGVLPGEGGKIMHAMLQINGAPLMLADAFPSCGSLDPVALKGSPVTIHMYVKDVDAAVAKAQAAGANVIMPVTDMFWGDRYGQVQDPFGHRWSIATHQRDVTPEEMQEAMKTMPTPGA